MKVDQKKAGILLNYISEAVKVITVLLYTPVMLQMLGQSEYGLYQLVSSTVGYLGLLSLGFGSAYVRFFSRYQVKNDQQSISKLNGMFMIIFCAMSFLCLVCGYFMTINAGVIFGEGLAEGELAKSKILMVILVISMAITFPNSVFVSYLIAHEEFVFQKIINIIQGVLNPFISLPLLLMGYGSVAVVAVSAFLTLATFVMNGLHCVIHMGMRFSFKKLDFFLLKEMWAFTFFIFLGQIIDQINWSVDKFLLGRMIDTSAVAVYGIGGQINTVYIQTSTAVSSVFVPQVNRIVAESDDNNALTSLMIKVGRVQFLVLTLVFTGFLVFGKQFISMWAGAGYDDSFVIALLLMFSVTIPLAQNLGIEILRARNRHQIRSAIYTCLAFGNLFLSIYLIKQLGIVGAAIGTAISMILGNGLFMNWYYHKKIGIDMIAFWREVCKLVPPVAVVALLGVCYTSVVEISNWPILALSICIYSVLYCAAVWMFGMNTNEKRIIRKLFSKLIFLGK